MLEHKKLERLLLESTGWRRFTQDSPIFADVWFAYREDPQRRQDLLLEPQRRVPAGELAKAVRERLGEVGAEHRLAYAGGYVVAELTLPELLAGVLPLSPWWKGLRQSTSTSVFEHLEQFAGGERLAPDDKGGQVEVPPPADELTWLLTVAGRLLTNTSDAEAEEQGLTDPRVLTRHVLVALGHPHDELLDLPPLWSVSLNRRVRATLWKSRETVKADAASRVFPTETEGLAWAVIDSGIDATHPAFRRRGRQGQAREAVGKRRLQRRDDRSPHLRLHGTPRQDRRGDRRRARRPRAAKRRLRPTR